MCVVVVIVMELRHFKLNLLYIHILRMKKIDNHFLLSFLDRLFLFNSVDEKIQKFQKPFIRPKKLFYYSYFRNENFRCQKNFGRSQKRCRFKTSF